MLIIYEKEKEKGMVSTCQRRVCNTVVRRGVRKGVESEVRGIGGWRWNWVSPDTNHPKLNQSSRLLSE